MIINWIACADRLPDKDYRYLVYAESADEEKPLIAIAWYTPGFGWNLLAPEWCDAITHWMPVPPGPHTVKSKNLRN